jgi:hypothetical protein
VSNVTSAPPTTDTHGGAHRQRRVSRARRGLRSHSPQPLVARRRRARRQRLTTSKLHPDPPGGAALHGFPPLPRPRGGAPPPPLFSPCRATATRPASAAPSPASTAQRDTSPVRYVRSSHTGTRLTKKTVSVRRQDRTMTSCQVWW